MLVLLLLKDASLTLKLRNYALSFTEVDYLGNVIKRTNIKIEIRTADSISELRGSPKVTELRLFLGLSNVLMRFMLEFGRIASVLSKHPCESPASVLGLLTEKELSAL